MRFETLFDDHARAVLAYALRRVDRSPLRSGDAVKDRYQLGAQVSGAVACGWVDRFFEGKRTGDTAETQSATQAMATSRRWHTLREMTAEGDYPKVLWEVRRRDGREEDDRDGQGPPRDGRDERPGRTRLRPVDEHREADSAYPRGMPSPPQFSVSSEAADLWRPNGDRLSYSDAGWIGASGGIVMHAALNFFSVAIPSLEPLLAPFAPAQSFAFALTANVAPLGRWLMLLLSEGVFWAIVAMLLLAVVHGVTDLIRGLLLRAARDVRTRTELLRSDLLLEQEKVRGRALGLTGR